MIKSIPNIFNLLVFSGLSLGASAQQFVELCVSDNMNGTMVHCTNVDDTLFATGFYTNICGSNTNFVAKWDGTTWLPTNIALPSAGHTLKEINNQFLLGTYVDAVDSNWVYEYDGTNLNKVGEGVYLTTATGFSELPNIYDIIEFNGQIYVCGEFDRVGNQPISGIMRWNGTVWEDVGGGLSGNIQGGPPIMYPHQMVVHDNELCVVGNFRFAGGVEVNGVAKWDGATWSALGDGFNSTVYGIGVYNGELFAGGDFTQSGTQTLKRIAKWNGTGWISPGFGFEPTGPNDYTFVHTFLEDNGEFYIAGGIRLIELDAGGTLDCGGIIRYSPSSIETFNGGIANNDIEAVGKTINGDILIGGGVFGNGYVGILNDTLVGVDEVELAISVSPNPMDELLNIETHEQIITLNILNSQGQTMNITRLNNKSIDVSELTRGIYFLCVETETGKGVFRLVK